MKRSIGSNQREHNNDLSSCGGDHAGKVAKRCSVGDGTIDCNELRCVKDYLILIRLTLVFRVLQTTFTSIVVAFSLTFYNLKS